MVVNPACREKGETAPDYLEVFLDIKTVSVSQLV
jgi:hypothetical protein